MDIRDLCWFSLFLLVWAQRTVILQLSGCYCVWAMNKTPLKGNLCKYVGVAGVVKGLLLFMQWNFERGSCALRSIVLESQKDIEPIEGL